MRTSERSCSQPTWSASLQGRVALGPRAGARVRRLGDEPDLGHLTWRGPQQAQLDGIDLHANVWVPMGSGG